MRNADERLLTLTIEHCPCSNQISMKPCPEFVQECRGSKEVFMRKYLLLGEKELFLAVALLRQPSVKHIGCVRLLLRDMKNGEIIFLNVHLQSLKSWC